MDKQEILMFEKAVEIQERKPDFNMKDFYSRKPDPKRNEFYIFIWLPTQSQLQGMLPENYGGCWSMLQDCQVWSDEAIENRSLKQSWSMESLWLAFVMHELYQKKWNGKDWVKI